MKKSIFLKTILSFLLILNLNNYKIHSNDTGEKGEETNYKSVKELEEFVKNMEDLVKNIDKELIPQAKLTKPQTEDEHKDYTKAAKELAEAIKNLKEIIKSARDTKQKPQANLIEPEEEEITQDELNEAQTAAKNAKDAIKRLKKEVEIIYPKSTVKKIKEVTPADKKTLEQAFKEIDESLEELKKIAETLSPKLTRKKAIKTNITNSAELRKALETDIKTDNLEQLIADLKIAAEKFNYLDLIHSNTFGSYNETLLHLAAKQDDIELLKALIIAGADVNATDRDGLTPLHTAVRKGNLVFVKYLVEKAGANIDIKNKAKLTAAQMAIITGKKDIGDYLYSKAISETIKVLDIIILIDDSNEINKQNGAITNTLKVNLKENAAPCLVLTKHLLKNAIDSLGTQFDLSKWIVLDFIYKNEIEGFLLIPKEYAQKWINTDIRNLTPLQICKNLGFSTENNFKIQQIDDRKKIKSETHSFFIFSEEKFSKLVKEVCENLLNNNYEKCIYLSGHGMAEKNVKEGFIAGISINEALDLFSALDDKKTRLIYVSTCFLGGTNLIEVQKSLNEKLNNSKIWGNEKSKMIFISGATTEISITDIPNSFTNFFREFKLYLNKNARLSILTTKKQLTRKEREERKNLTKEIGSLRNERKYFSENIARWLTDYTDATAIPQIRFPVQDAKFYSLAPAVIDALTPKTPFTIEDQIILVVNLPNVDFPIIIQNKYYAQLPVLITGTELHDITFQEISVKKPINFETFMSEMIEGTHKKKDLFSEMPYKEVFKIKKLILNDIVFTNIEIKRGPSNKFHANYFTDSKNYEYKNINNKATISEIGSKATKEKISDIVGEDLLRSQRPANIKKLEDDLNKAKERNINILKSPKILNSFYEAIRYGDIDKINIIAKAEPQIVNYADQNGITPLQRAIKFGHTDLVRYLTIDEKASLKQTDNDGNSAFHYAAQNGNLEIAQILNDEKLFSSIEELWETLTSRNNNGETPSLVAAKYGNLAVFKYFDKNEKKLIREGAFDSKGNSAIHIAAKYGQLEIVKHIVEQINEDLKNIINKNNQKTPLHYAAQYGHFNIVEYLVNKKVAINIRDLPDKYKPIDLVQIELKKIDTEEKFEKMFDAIKKELSPEEFELIYKTKSIPDYTAYKKEYEDIYEYLLNKEKEESYLFTLTKKKK